MNWHYVDQGKQVGPVTEEQLAELFRAGKIQAATFVWRAGLANWIPYGEIIAAQTSDNPPAATTPAPTLNEGEAVCAECGKVFPANEMIRHGNAYICANCKPLFMQKLAEGAPVLAPGELRYAGFWIRFCAKFVDGLIIGLPLGVLYMILVVPIVARTHGAAPPELGVLPLLLQFAMIFVNLAYQVFFLGKYGATPGKMACKLKVVTADGGKIGYGRAAGRFFAEMLSGMICYIGYLMVAFDNPQKRALHDHICNTRVVYK